MPQQIKSAQDLFIHDLGDVLSAEQTFMKAMNQMLQNVQHQEVRQGLERHIQETEQQIKNLEQAFQLLGQKVEAPGCPGAEGIVAEYRKGVGEIQSPDLIDLFTLGASMKGEHYEIAGYRGLVNGARLMGNNQLVQLLQQNLQQEEAFAMLCEQTKTTLAKQVMGSETGSSRGTKAA